MTLRCALLSRDPPVAASARCRLLIIIGWGISETNANQLDRVVRTIANLTGHEGADEVAWQVNAGASASYALLFLIALFALYRGCHARQEFRGAQAKAKKKGKEAAVKLGNRALTRIGFFRSAPAKKAAAKASAAGASCARRCGSRTTEFVLYVFDLLPLIGVILGVALLAVAAAVLGASIAADAGCRWVTDLLNTTQMDLVFGLMSSNASSLSGALGELDLPLHSLLPSIANLSGVNISAPGALATSEMEGLMSSLSSQALVLLPAVNATLGAVCDVESMLQTVDVATVCTRLAVVVDLVVETLNGPPLHAGLNVSGTRLLAPVCGPAEDLVAAGASGCARLPVALATASASLQTATSYAAVQLPSEAQAAQEEAMEVAAMVQYMALQALGPLLELVDELVNAFDPVFLELRRLARESGLPAYRDPRDDLNALCAELFDLDVPTRWRLVAAVLALLGAVMVRIGNTDYSDMIYLGRMRRGERATTASMLGGSFTALDDDDDDDETNGMDSIKAEIDTALGPSTPSTPSKPTTSELEMSVKVDSREK